MQSSSRHARDPRENLSFFAFWASVIYGLGIFITISRSERHNYLAVKLSRYRSDDPYAANAANFPWIGQDRPKLEPTPDDEFSVDIPGYDLRRILLAEDPLAVANAFFRTNKNSASNRFGNTYVSKLPALCRE